MDKAEPNRRQFLQKSALLSASSLAFPAVVRAGNANSRLRIAVIGTGGRGGHNMNQVGKTEDIVALCDVDARKLKAAASTYPEAKTYRDFRELHSDPDAYDAVVVSTCEHTHAFATLPALRAGKHVYCEKPLTRDVHEARMVTEAAEKAGVATQMGTQIHAGENYRRVVELIQGKAVGPIKEVHVWVSRAWGWQSEEDARAHGDIVSAREKPTEAMDPPPYLDWDLWLGPAPYRSYHDVYFPGPKWYRWWDFGNGTMSDLGSHWNDLPFWALNLDAPTKVEAGGPPPHPELAPASMWARYEYPARDDRQALSLTWYQGTEKPSLWKENQIPRWNSGVLFVGEKGMVLSDYGRHLVFLGENVRKFERPEKSIPPSKGHHAEWLHACRTGEPTTCPFSYAGPLTEANHLGTVAFRAGTAIEWDAANLRIPNAPEAERFLKTTYRPGWSLEG